MWSKSFSKTYIGLSKERVWNLWTDVNNWPRWHGDLDYCQLKGAFAVGNHFMLKPKGVKAVKVTLTKIVEGHAFTDCTHFFGAKMYDTHKLEETQDGLCLSNQLVVCGPLKWLWIWLVANHVARSVPHEMDALAALARKN